MKGSYRVSQSNYDHSSEFASGISQQPRSKWRAMGTAFAETKVARWALICACFCAFSASGSDSPKPPQDEQPITVVWPLTYSTGRVKAIQGQVSLTSSQGSSPVTKDTIDQLVEALNAVAATEEKTAAATAANPANTNAHTETKPLGTKAAAGTAAKAASATTQSGTKDAAPASASKEANAEPKKEEPANKESDAVQYVRRVRNNLLITAKPKTVLKIKRLLTFLDTPWPQVQLDVFAFQVSGCPEQVAKRTQAVRDHINKAKHAMRKAEKAVCETVRIWNDQKAPYSTCSTFRTLQKQCKFDLNPNRELTLTEALTFLCLSDIDIMSILKQKLAQHLGSVDPKFKDNPWEELNEITQENVRCYRNTVEQFADAWDKFQNNGSASKDINACEILQQASGITDRLLQKVMDQYTAMVRTNLTAMMLPPLRDTDGVSLAGQCRIVVTSSLESGLIPTMASWAETTRVKPFSAEEMSTIMTTVIKSLATNGLDPTVLAPALKLLEQPEPVYTKVAPGIELHVRPTVLPSAAEARLQIYARFGVKTEPDTTKSNAEKLPPAPAVESHEMATDAHIGIFDLFDISSFEITTSHPRMCSIPFISRIPWLGVMFQFPLPNKNTKHVSIILVNAVIIPRAVNLLSDYP